MHACVRRIVQVLLVAVLVAPGPASAAAATAASARSLYQAAQARHREAKTALGRKAAPEATTLRAVRAAISAYRRVVSRYPASSYCDDALWYAAELAREAYAAFGEARDQETARTLLAMLVREYPSSQFVGLARGALDESPDGAGALVIRKVTPDASVNGVDVGLDAHRDLEFVASHLENPLRYYVDLPGTRAASALRGLALRIDSALVSQVRLGAQPKSTTRIVLDLKARAACQTTQLASPPRIEIRCAAAPSAEDGETTSLASSTSAPLGDARAIGTTAMLPAAPQQAMMGATANPPPARGTKALKPTVAPPLIAAPSVPTLAPPEAPPVEPPAPPKTAAEPPSVAPPLTTAVAPPAIETPAPPAAPDIVRTFPAAAEPAAEPAPRSNPIEEAEPLWAREVEAPALVELPPARFPAQPLGAGLPSGGARVPFGSAYAGFTPRTLMVQQPGVQITAASQFTTGDDRRLGSQPRVEPDLGIQVFQPGLRIGTLYADVNITRRNDQAVVGRGVVRLDGLQIGGLRWSIDGGDTWNAPVVQHFGFSNLFAPAVTFQGLSASGSGPSTFVLVSGGRVTAQRNIFGTDTSAIGQQIYQGLVSHRSSDELDVFGHANHTVSGDMQFYTALTDWSTDAGGGVRYRPRADVELIADGSLTRFQRRGAADTDTTVSGLLGSLWSFGKGFAQANIQRYPLGRYPVFNYPYSDRSGAFALAEYDLGSRVRVFGGFEYSLSALDRDAAAEAASGVAPGEGGRGHGGVRIGVFDASLVTIRADFGGRRLEPSRYNPGFEANTGVLALDWHGRFRTGSAFARYERRTNDDASGDASSFTQHNAMAQMYFNLAGNRQAFGQVLLSSREDQNGDGETVWQAGGGAQMSFGPLYARMEGTVGRSRTWATQVTSPRQSLSAGISGMVASQTYLSLDVYVDRMSLGSSIANPWVTRTMVRFTRMFPYGTARSPQFAGQVSRGGPVGRVTGNVFADWNGNGLTDPDEEGVGGVTLVIPGIASVSSGADGRFAFSGIPAGEQRVAVDLSSVPADYDPPAEAERLVSISRHEAASVAIGMIPLGAFDGMVFLDVDGNGAVGAADTPVDGAVLVMDDGVRTEVSRDGRFSFDPVRMGTHTVNLLVDSLPEGALIDGPSTIEVELTRSEPTRTVVFLVKVEKRPEIRKVFPPKKK